jgi:hypothetical protein
MGAGCGQEILDVCPNRRKSLICKYARQDLNLQPLAPEAVPRLKKSHPMGRAEVNTGNTVTTMLENSLQQHSIQV